MSCASCGSPGVIADARQSPINLVPTAGGHPGGIETPEGIPIPLTDSWRQFIADHGDGDVADRGSILPVGGSIVVTVALETLLGIQNGSAGQLNPPSVSATNGGAANWTILGRPAVMGDWWLRPEYIRFDFSGDSAPNNAVYGKQVTLISSNQSDFSANIIAHWSSAFSNEVGADLQVMIAAAFADRINLGYYAYANVVGQRVPQDNYWGIHLNSGTVTGWRVFVQFSGIPRKV